MMIHRTLARVFGGIVAGLLVAVVPGIVSPPQAPVQKSNILFIMGDDIGWMQPGIYHEGLAAGETPNIDQVQKPYLNQTLASNRNAIGVGSGSGGHVPAEEAWWPHFLSHVLSDGSARSVLIA
jgi:hypothetical protein